MKISDVHASEQKEREACEEHFQSPYQEST